MSSVLETELLTLEQALEKHPPEPRPKPTTDANGNPIIYTGPEYSFDPNRKTPRGSFLRILKDGTVSYNNPDCLEYAAPGSKPFKLPNLKPRNDGSAATFERLKALIEKRAAKRPHVKTSELIGRPCLDDTWHVVATDGHTALLKRGPGEGEHNTIFDYWTGSRLIASIDNPEFHLALKRALIMAEEPHNVVRFVASPGTLELSSSHGEPRGQIENNDAGDFAETLEINTCEPWRMAMNGSYIEPVCGSWPLSVWFISENSPVMFESEEGTWRYVVCPVSADWNDVQQEHEAQS